MTCRAFVVFSCIASMTCAVAGKSGADDAGAKLIAESKAVIDTFSEGTDYKASLAKLDAIFDRAFESVSPRKGDAFRAIALHRRLAKLLNGAAPSMRPMLLKAFRDQPAFMHALLFAIKPQDNPTKVTAVIDQLVRRNQLARFPNLAAAVCLVHDEPLTRQIVENKTTAPAPVAIFDYYAANAKKMAFDPGRAPVTLLIWVVDFTGSVDELKWVLTRYRGRQSLGKVYFEIEYDLDHLRRGVPKRVTQEGYTLPNIARYGGVCADQAYFAMSVGKAIGIPSTMAKGERSQVFHAWVGFIRQQNRTVVWDFNTGRYAAYKTLRGMVTDPQTRQLIPDSYVSLTAGAMTISNRERWHAIALTDALQHQISKSGAQGNSVSQRWIEALEAALLLNAANADIWSVVGDASEKGLLSLSLKRDIANLLMKVAGKRFPDFTLAVLKRLIVSIEGTAEQERIWSSAGRLFKSRPELMAEIMMARAEMWKKAGDDRRAGSIYSDVVIRYANSGPFVVEAVKQTEQQLMKLDRAKSVPKLYENCLNRTEKPGNYSVQFRELSNWYRVATLYQQWLEKNGETRKAGILAGIIMKELEKDKK